ncbi:prophage minor tail Z family protein [Enterobacter hormaechei]|nr:prophage minor tail Z family protein [Enterobacter hormaechei]
MSIKGLEQAIANLDSLDRNMVPNASAWAVNRVAANGVSVAVRRVAKETVAGDTGMLTLRGWHDATGGGYTSWQLASTSQGLKYRQGNGTVSGLTNVGFS